MARLFLQTAADKVDGYWANTTYLNLAEIHQKIEDNNTAKNLLNKYINKFEKKSKNINGGKTATQILNDEIKS